MKKAIALILILTMTLSLGVSLQATPAAPQLSQPTVPAPTETTAPPTQPTEPAPTATEPTETLPPETEPAETEPPVTQPPETEPPATEPPVTQPPATEPPPPPEPEYYSKYAFVYDLTAGELLFNRGDMTQQMYPASLTKLFTAYVALQYLDPQAVVTVGDEVGLIGQDSSRAFLEKGQQLTVEMLIAAMLLPSGNDAAYVTAVAVARAEAGAELSVPEAVAHFAVLMNHHAAAQGMTGTHFTSPDGYHDNNHYSTCTDIMTIARLALETPLIAQTVKLPERTVTLVSGESYTWRNTNELLHPTRPGYHPEAIGLKTGCTSQAGWCLLSAFQRDGRILVIAAMGTRNNDQRLQDILKLYQMFG